MYDMILCYMCCDLIMALYIRILCTLQDWNFVYSFEYHVRLYLMLCYVYSSIVLCGYVCICG
nr:MAG TPA: hypothetical protein [Caudoviricetes sp.]